MPENPSRRARPVNSERVALLFILLAAAGLLTPILDGGFLTDDFFIMRSVARRLDRGGEIGANLVGLAALYGRGADPRFQLYRPTPIATFGLNYLLSGTEPRPYLITNLAFHLLGGIALHVLLFQLVREARPAARLLGVAFFLASPLQIETVAWTVLRGETLSFLFVATALALRFRRSESRLVPCLLFAAALTCKESALGVAPALLIPDLLGPRGRRRGAAARTAAGLVAILAAYFILRHQIFGHLFESSYNRRPLAEYVGPDHAARFARSLRILVVPLSRPLFAESWLWWPLVAASIGGFGVVFVTAVRTAWAERKAVLLAAAIVLAGPAVLGIMVTEVNDELVNTRSFYTPLAALAILIALTSSSRRRPAQLIAPFVLLGVAVIVSRPCQMRYVRAAADIDQAHRALRDALGRIESRPGRRVAILGFSDRIHFGGGFTLHGGLGPALCRPFLADDHAAIAVESPSRNNAFARYTPLEEILANERGDLVLLAMHTTPDGGVEARVVAEDVPTEADADRIRLIAPRSGEVQQFRRGRARSVTIRFSARRASIATVGITAFDARGRIGPEARFPAASLDGRRRGDEATYTMRLAISADQIALMPRRTVQGWLLTAYDDDGHPTARSAPRLSRIEVD